MRVTKLVFHSVNLPDTLRLLSAAGRPVLTVQHFRLVNSAGGCMTDKIHKNVM